MSELSSLFKGLADHSRLRVFYLLCLHDELCVCYLVEALALPQSSVSRHLGKLKHCGLVTAERRGKWVYYQLPDNEAVMSLKQLVLAQADECNHSDARRLRALCGNEEHPCH